MPPDAVKVEGQLTFFPYPRTISAFPRVERDGFETFHHDGDGCEYVSDFFGG